MELMHKDKMKITKSKQSRKSIALLLCVALIFSMLPLNTSIAKAATQISNPRISNGVTTWDCIYFGNYWQNDTNGDGKANQNDEKEPIKWRVLSVDGDDAFLLADQNLDYQPYNKVIDDVTWETCTLRTFLNRTFLNNSFSVEEQQAIFDSTVVNKLYHGIDGGTDTIDKVYLLAIEDVTNTIYGFDTSTYNCSSVSREARNTFFATNRCDGSSPYIGLMDSNYGDNCSWWLRSPGENGNIALIVRYDGYGCGSGYTVGDGFAVRPVLHLNLSSQCWSYAGTVTANIGESTGGTPTPMPDSSSDGKIEGTSGNLKIGEDQAGSADSSSGVGKFFPATWSLKSTKYPLELSQTQNADGTYTIKGSIGIGRSDLLNKESEWKKYKEACDKANKTMSEYDTLYAYKDMFGLQSSNVIHATGWNGSKQPELSVMGYVENKYDAYGRLIKAEGKVAGEMAWKGGATWNFVTPVGPMYLKFEAGGKIKLSVGPTWDNTNEKMSLDGSLKITPSISLTGGYGFDGVASVSAKGGCTLPIDLISRNQGSWGTKGSIKAEASVNAFVLFVVDATWTLATYQKTLWDSTNSVTSLDNGITNNSFKTMMLNTEFAEETTKWRGNAKSLNSENAKTLQEGILKSSIPLTSQIGDKKVLVWQDYDASRSVANSSVLKYSVLQNGTWSTPKAVYDDGFGDSYADLKVINDELYLVWQKQTKKIETTDVDKVVEELGVNSEIYFAKFDKSNSTFDEIEQLTNNDECDMLPQFVENSDSIKIAYINNSGDIYQKSGTNTIKCFDITNNSTIDIASQSDAIGKYEAFDMDGTVEVAYTTTSDEETLLKSTYDDYQYHLDELSTSEDALSVGGINYSDGTIHTIINGKLYQYDIENDSLFLKNAGEESFDNNAIFVSNGEKSAYVWSSYDEDTGVGTIKGSIKSSNGQYTNPVELFATSENVARVLAPILDADGNWSVVANEENLESSLHSLVYYAKEEEVSSLLLSASVNEFEIDENETGIDYVYKNEGDKTVNNLCISVKAEDGTEVNKKIPVYILPGETLAKTAYIDLTSISKGQPIEISVSEENESLNDENTVSDHLAKTNLSIIGKATEENGTISVSASVENKGLDDATGTIELYKDKDKSAKIVQKENVRITSGEISEIDFSISLSDIIYDDNGAAYLPLCVNTNGEDYDESDNSVYLALYKGENVNVDTTPQQTVSVVVDEDEESVNPTPGPTPTLIPVATPNVTPVVALISTPTPTPTATSNATPTPTLNATPTPTLTATPNVTPTPTPTATPNAMPSPTPVVTSSATPKVIPSPTPKVIPSVTQKQKKIKNVTGFRAKASKGKLRLSWKRVSEASGYEIQYSLNKKFRKPKKVAIKKRNIKSKIIKGLKKKKKYFIRIRAYKKSKGKKIYSAWKKISKKTK